MQILPINKTNFKGLVGETISTPVAAGDYLRYFEDTNYYPFKEESNKEIDNFVKRASRGYSGDMLDITRNIHVKPHLPFTENEFHNYQRNFTEGKPATEADNLVEKTLSASIDLWRYLNEKPKIEIVKKDSFFTKLIKSVKRLIGKR